MPIMYNQQNVDSRFAAILEPNLYYGSVFVPGVTFTDKYELGPAGQIYVHKLDTSAAEPGKPGRDFTDEETKDNLIPITLNNNFQKSKKIYGVQAGAVAFPLAAENLALAIAECREGWQQSMLACLVNEGTAATATAELTPDDVKGDVIASRQEIIEKKGRANVVMCAPCFYSLVLRAAGRDFTPVQNDRIAQTGNVGMWLGMTFLEAAGGSAASAKYYDHAGTLKTVSFTGLQYAMYYHETLSGVTNFDTSRLVDSELFVGTKAQVEMNSGFRVTNNKLVLVRKSVPAVAAE